MVSSGNSHQFMTPAGAGAGQRERPAGCTEDWGGRGLKSIQPAAPGIGAERPIPFTVCTGRCSTGAVGRQQVEQRQIDGRRKSKPIVPSEGCSSGHAGRLSSKQEDQWNGLPDLDSPVQR
jgi:hypothetical protein